MLGRIYYWMHRFFSKPQERGEYSAGVWQDRIRSASLQLCGWEGNILEVGCGEGLFLGQLNLARERLQLWGVDNSSVRIERTRKRLEGKKIHLSVEDATKLSFEDGFFDKVVCINVFFNMPGIDTVRKTVLEMKRVAKNDARLIFDFRNADNPLLALKYSLAPLYDPTVKTLPLKTYSLAQIRSLLDSTGLEIVSLDHFGALFKIWAPIILVEAKKR